MRIFIALALFATGIGVLLQEKHSRDKNATPAKGTSDAPKPTDQGSDSNGDSDGGGDPPGKPDTPQPS